MKAGAFLVVVTVLAGALAGVARAGEPSAAQSTALERLRAASSTPVSARFDGGAARFVGATVTADGATAVDRALSFLDRFRDLYGLSDPRTQLQVVRQAGEGDAQDVFFGESVGSVPVQDAQLGVHLVGGSVIATSGAYLPLLPAGTKPVIGASAAVVTAQQAAKSTADPLDKPAQAYFNAGLTMNAAERKAWGLDEESHLVWQVTLPSRVSYVDARSGRELIAFSPNDDAATSLWIRTTNNTGPGSFCSYPGATDWFNENGVLPGATPDLEGTGAFANFNTAYDYFFTKFGRRSYDDHDGQVRVNLDVPLSIFGGTPNAQYNSNCHHFELTNNMATKDVVAHEFTHGVTDFSAHLAAFNQPGALDEHFSDVFAAMIDTANWTIGEGTPAAALGLVRDMRDPTAFSQPDNMGAFVVTTGDFGGRHINNGIPNKVAFLVTVGGFHRGFQISGLGRIKTERLWYEVLTTKLGPNSDFAQQRDLTVLQADTWATGHKNGFTSSDACNVRNAFASVGLGDGNADCDANGDAVDPDDDNDGVLDASDNCISIANPNQVDTDSDGMGNACSVDDDGDAVLDTADNCVLVKNPGQGDADHDGIGDACDLLPNGDDDFDGVDNVPDNCHWVPNPDQKDFDGDHIGDACDDDWDNDKVENHVDNCNLKANADQKDTDGDGIGDACDNAPNDANPDQADHDHDGKPDVVDPDDDNDGVLDGADNCPFVANASQIDADHDGVGDACESIAPGLDARLAFEARDKYFERLQIVVLPCLPPKCESIDGPLKLTVGVESEYKLELQVLDPRGEVVARGVSGEPLSFEARPGEDGRPLEYRLDVLPSPEFEPGNEYGFTAGLRPGDDPF